MGKENIQYFEDQPIRAAWDEEKEEWYFSVVDVVGVLTEQSDQRGASNYWAKLKQRLKEEGANELITKLGELIRLIFRPENLIVDITGTEKEYDGIEDETLKFASSLYSENVKEGSLNLVPVKKNEGYKTAGQVQYVCRAGNFAKDGRKYNGALRVLKVMMGYDYLWKNIRVLGGAYGCMSSFAKNGDAAFVTYRDPNLQNSIDVFEKAADYLRNFDSDDRTILQYIIGAISDLDTPKTPSAKGAYGLTAFLCNAKMENIQKNRDALLSTTRETIRGLSEYVDAFMEDGCLCVIGGADKIEESRDLFDTVEQLVER